MSSEYKHKRDPLLDDDWAGRAFLIPEWSLQNALDDYRRYYTSSSRKFVNSGIGGHFVVNPIPQFTANCDVPHMPYFDKGLDSPSRYWSERLDDPQQIIHMRPGVPKFNSLTTFFGNFYNVELGSIARTGRAPGLFYSIGRVVGTIGTLPFQPFILGGAAIKFFFNMPRSKYYYLQPTPFPYRVAVQAMMNAIMVNEGLITGSYSTATNTPGSYYDPSVLPSTVDTAVQDNSYSGILGRYGYTSKYGGIDIFAISTSAARLGKDFRKAIESEIEDATGLMANASIDDLKLENPDRFRQDIIDRIIVRGIEDNLAKLNYKHYPLHKVGSITTKNFEEVYEQFSGSVAEDENWQSSSLAIVPQDPERDPGLWKQFTSFVTRAWEQAATDADYGSDFVGFRVNWTGSQSESFSNQSGESSLASKVNGISSRAREIRFNTADGNIVGGMTGKIIGTVADSLKDIVTGALDSVNLSGAVALMGSAFADIQKMYQASSADLNRTSFTMHFRSWSADPWVRNQNLWLPLAHILCLGLPRATGPGSYDGPFLVECINQGKTIIREGLIESIQIERGVGDIGFGRNREALGIDVTVTVADLSSILSIPIAMGVGNLASATAATIGNVMNVFGAEDGVASADTFMATMNKGLYSEDTKYTDYIAAITSVPFENLINPKRKWRLRMSRLRADMASNRTAANMGSFGAGIIQDILPGESFKTLFGDSSGRR